MIRRISPFLLLSALGTAQREKVSSDVYLAVALAAKIWRRNVNGAVAEEQPCRLSIVSSAA